MGILAFDLFALGVACIFIKAEWLIPIRRYPMMILMISGAGLGSMAATEIDRDISLFLGCVAVFLVGLFIWSICKHTETIEIIHIPADSYEIIAEDRPSAPNTQMRYFLIYQNVVYTITTVPSIGRPPLVLYAKKYKNMSNIFAYIAIDFKQGTLSTKEKLHNLYGYIVLIVALLIPVGFYYSDSVSGGLMGIVIGYGMRCLMSGSKTAINRFQYWIGVFLEVSGWLALPVAFLM